MTDTVNRLRGEARKLSPVDRSDLIDALIADEATPDVDWERSWAKECTKRYDDLRSGRVSPVTWDEFLSKRGRAA